MAINNPGAWKRDWFLNLSFVSRSILAACSIFISTPSLGALARDSKNVDSLIGREIPNHISDYFKQAVEIIRQEIGQGKKSSRKYQNMRSCTNKVYQYRIRCRISDVWRKPWCLPAKRNPGRPCKGCVYSFLEIMISWSHYICHYYDVLIDLLLLVNHRTTQGALCVGNTNHQEHTVLNRMNAACWAIMIY